MVHNTLKTLYEYFDATYGWFVQMNDLCPCMHTLGDLSTAG